MEDSEKMTWREIVIFLGRMLVRLIVLLIPLGLIGAGVWQISPPWAFISVGLLIWIDYNTGSSGKKNS